LNSHISERTTKYLTSRSLRNQNRSRQLNFPTSRLHAVDDVESTRTQRSKVQKNGLQMMEMIYIQEARTFRNDERNIELVLHPIHIGLEYFSTAYSLQPSYTSMYKKRVKAPNQIPSLPERLVYLT